MARNFDGSSSYLRHDAAVVTAVPITIACWFNKTAAEAGTYTLAAAVTSASTSNQFALRYINAATGNINQVGALTVQTLSSQATVNAPLTSEFYAGVWVHCAAVFAATNNRVAYFNGTAGAAQTTTRTPSGVGRFSVGVRDASSQSEFTKGSIAEVGVWSIALSADEIASLAKAVCPLLIRPNNLVAYWPLYGRSSGVEIDVVGGFNQTISGATQAAYPRIYNPNRRKLGVYVAPPAAGQPAIKRMGGVTFAANPWRHVQGTRGW